MSRIYDDPNHPSYGPVRRLWVMVSGLYGFDHTKLDKEFYEEWGSNWDEHVNYMLAQQGFDEQRTLRLILWRILDTSMF